MQGLCGPVRNSVAGGRHSRHCQDLTLHDIDSHICTYVSSVCVYTSVFNHMCVDVYVFAYAYAYVHVHVDAYMHMHMYICVCIYM